MDGDGNGRAVFKTQIQKGRWKGKRGEYSGKVRRGLREGEGTFTCEDGNVYRGSWRADNRHGFGVEEYTGGS